MNRVIRSLFAITLSLSAADSVACSCAKVSAQQHYLDAGEVFLGKVIETKLITETQSLGDQEVSEGRVRATISVTKTLKGKDSQTREITDRVVDGANCGVGLFTGREYLFYLSKDQSISICGGTKLYNEFSDKALIDEMLLY